MSVRTEPTGTTRDRKNPGCAFGPCNDSKQVGGPGCHLCDDVATLPQRGRGAVVEEAPDPSTVAADDDGSVLKPVSEAKKVKKGSAAPRQRRGSQVGRLW